ncbi:MAG: HNH endonuclease [Solirubrobacteraceae bacterium]
MRTRRRTPAAPQPRLTIELVPLGQWGANLSQSLAGERWDTIRRAAYRAAGYRCEVCGGKGPQWPVEAHEEWEYDEANAIQRLRRIVALCPACHEVKHIGRAMRLERGEAARRHLMAVNKWTGGQALRHIEDALHTWDRRNLLNWTLELSLVDQYGVTPPSDAELRASVAREAHVYGNAPGEDMSHLALLDAVDMRLPPPPEDGWGMQVRELTCEECRALIDEMSPEQLDEYLEHLDENG